MCIFAFSVHLPLLTCSNELHHFHAASFTLPDLGHVVLVNGVVEWIMTARIVPAVALETVYCAAPFNKTKTVLTSIILFHFAYYK